MTSPTTADSGDEERGILAATGDTSGFGILSTHTAQVNVILPGQDEDDLLDDEIVADEVVVAGLDDADLLAPSGADDVEPLEAEIVETGPVPPLRGADRGSEHDAVDAVEIVDEVPAVRVEPTDAVAAATAVGDVPARTLPPRGAAGTGLRVRTGSVPTSASSSGGGTRTEAGRSVARVTSAVAATTGPATSDPTPPTGSVPAVAPSTDATLAAAPAVISTASVSATSAVDAAPVSTVTGPQDTRWARAHPDDPNHEDRAHAVERVNPPREVSLTSRRIDEFEPHRESADLLTADRLLDRQRAPRSEPEGGWQHFVWTLTGGRINLGDGRRARVRKELGRRIAAPIPGGAKFVPVLSRKGGVGKTTVTTLLGMALADARDDRVIAVDANPDRGTLADRFSRSSGRTVRDLVRRRGQITDFHELSSIVARDETRLDVLASDADPRVSEAFSDRDYHDVASIAAHYYSIVVTDTGTGVVHSVMGATLDLADQIVVVAGLSVDEARLASEMLTWLDTNGYGQQVREAVVVLNNSRPGSPLVRRGELETHFRSRVRAVVHLPYDPMVAAGSAISFRDLQPETREAARRIAAEVVGGLKQSASAA